MRREFSEPRASSTSDALAPRWHTAALVTLILLVAITGNLLRLVAPAAVTPSPIAAAPITPGQRIIGQYLPLLLVNWALLGYVSRLFRPRSALRDLLGRGWQSARQAAGDLGLALLVFAFVQSCEVLSAHLLAARQSAALQALVPSTEAERLTWLVVAASVGFCEEVVYRGYLQKQLTAWSGSAGWAVVGQALLFGIAHTEQGLLPALRIAVYGLVLGLLARWRGSLLPGIACHVAIDLASAIAR